VGALRRRVPGRGDAPVRRRRLRHPATADSVRRGWILSDPPGHGWCRRLRPRSRRYLATPAGCEAQRPLDQAPAPVLADHLHRHVPSTRKTGNEW